MKKNFNIILIVINCVLFNISSLHANGDDAFVNAFKCLFSVPKDQDSIASFNSMQNAAREGSKEATYILGLLPKEANSIKLDSLVPLLKQHLNEPDHEADAIIGCFCYSAADANKPQLFKVAASFLERAANANIALAQNLLGSMYECGVAKPKNIPMAIQLYQQASDQGFLLAKENLTRLLKL